MLLVPCPCCGLPTITTLGAFDVCPVCWWEDDGQDDTDADEINGGPNGDYSLTRARANARAHGDMYDPGDGIAMVKHPTKARLALMAQVRHWRETGTAPVASILAELIDAQWHDHGDQSNV